MKIVKVAPVHVWDDVRVFHKEAISLKNAGFNVTILARSECEREVEGVTVKPVLTSKRFRIVRFLMLPMVALQALRLRGDVYHLHNPDSIVVGVILKLFGKRVVYDSHEDFMEKLKVRHWVPNYLRKALIFLVFHLERFISSLAEFSIATQQEVADRFKGKVIVLGNLPTARKEKAAEVYDIVGQLKQKLGDVNQGRRLSYIGEINASRGLFEMVEALARVNAREQESVRLWLIGSADEADLLLARSMLGWKYVDYIERLPQEQAFAYVCMSEIGLVVIRDEGGHAYTDPNKIYEYMRFGVPFIASDFELWRKRLEATEAGIFVQPSVEGLANGILQLLNQTDRAQMGLNGQSYVRKNNWDSDFVVLENAYNDL